VFHARVIRAAASAELNQPLLTSAFPKTAAILSSPTKRSLNDENFDPTPAFLASPHKRVKSTLSDTLSTVLKSAAGASGARTQKRVFGALIDVTNTRTAAPCLLQRHEGSENLKSGITKPTRSVMKPPSSKKSNSTSSPIKKQVSPSRRNRLRAPTPPDARSSYGTKRTYNTPIFKRVDPPSSTRLSYNISSIDSLLRGTGHSPLRSASSIADPDNSSTVDGAELPTRDIASALSAPAIPDSWTFTIYEDTPEETMQNLMEHSTHTLDISDDSGNESDTSELQEKGKENIPPTRLSELLAVAPQDGGNAMRLETHERLIPQRRAPGGGPSGRHLRERRDALREMRKEELVIHQPTDPKANGESGGSGVKSQPCNDFVENKDNECDVLVSTPKSPGSPGWAIWESDHEEGDEEAVEQTVIACKVPLPVDDELEEAENSGKEN
jgi:hypothetical protein